MADNEYKLKDDLEGEGTQKKSSKKAQKKSYEKKSKLIKNRHSSRGNQSKDR